MKEKIGKKKSTYGEGNFLKSNIFFTLTNNNKK